MFDIEELFICEIRCWSFVVFRISWYECLLSGMELLFLLLLKGLISFVICLILLMFKFLNIVSGLLNWFWFVKFFEFNKFFSLVFFDICDFFDFVIGRDFNSL